MIFLEKNDLNTDFLTRCNEPPFPSIKPDFGLQPSRRMDPILFQFSKTKVCKLRGRTVTDTTPIFTYTVNGVEYTYKAEMSTTNRNRFSVGQKEFIFINENHPNEARYGSNLGFLLWGIVCLLLGTAVIVLLFW